MEKILIEKCKHDLKAKKYLKKFSAQNSLWKKEEEKYLYQKKEKIHGKITWNVFFYSIYEKDALGN